MSRSKLCAYETREDLGKIEVSGPFHISRNPVTTSSKLRHGDHIAKGHRAFGSNQPAHFHLEN